MLRTFFVIQAEDSFYLNGAFSLKILDFFCAYIYIRVFTVFG